MARPAAVPVATSVAISQHGVVPAHAAASSEVVTISGNTFNPSQTVKEEIIAGGKQGLDVRVIVKDLTAEGSVRIAANGAQKYNSIGQGTMPLLNDWTQRLGGMHLNFSVANGGIEGGFASFTPRGGKGGDWLSALQKNSSALGGLGLKIQSLPKKLENKFENGQFVLGVNDLGVEVGGFADAVFNVSIENMKAPHVDAAAHVNIKGIVEGELKLDNAAGPLAGQISLAVKYPSFSGAATVKYCADGSIDVSGKAAYTGGKLSGEVEFVATDLESANHFAKDAIAAAGGLSNVQEAGPPAAVPQPKPGQKRALAAAGQLKFNLTQWFAGTVHVVVDGKGAVTVIGKIAPPAEIELFKQKDWKQNLISFEAKAYYGIPVVGNLNLFAKISLDAIAKLGPAKIYNIEILGTYSTDPEIQKNIQISGSINISAYGGLRLGAEGGAGVEILAHDLKFGIGLHADVGVQAYADARPTIGYRDPGVFYISGVLEMVAQPVLGLGGEFFIALEAPWWSPLSDERWSWPLFSKEWPMTDPIGISASVKNYVLGSGDVPEIELKKPTFDPSKFMTSMVDKTLPDKSAGAGAAKGTFKDDGAAPKPQVPPKKPAPAPAAAKSPGKGNALKTGKSGAGDPKAAKEKAKGKALQDASTQLQALKSSKPLTRSELDKELEKIRAHATGVSFDVKTKGDKWNVAAKTGKSPKSVDIAAKDLHPKDKDEKGGARTDAQKKADLHGAINEARTLMNSKTLTPDQVKAQLPAIKLKYRLTIFQLVTDSKQEGKETDHVHGEIHSDPLKEDGAPVQLNNEKEDGKMTPFTIPRPAGFTAETAKALNPDGKNLKLLKLDRRHVISSKDMAEHYETTLLQQDRWLKARELLASRKEAVAKPLSNAAIADAAKNRHQRFFNDLKNLFLGPRGHNRALGRRVDTGSDLESPHLTEEGLKEHVEYVSKEWCLGPFTPTPP